MKNPDQYNFKGKKALIRADFNVPIDKNGSITDNSRILAALPTIRKVLDDGGAAIIMSHLGRPKGKFLEEYSLLPVASELSRLLRIPVFFAKDVIGEDAQQKAAALKTGEVLLIENLRFYPEEEAGNCDFAKALAALGDVYINDAFGTAHRAHASTAAIADYFPHHKLAGYLMDAEIKSMDKILNEHERPFTAIIGGVKVSDKVDIIRCLLDKADHILIGGAMAYTFIKALGGHVGNSKTEDNKLTLAKELAEQAKRQNVHLMLPDDSLSADTFSPDAESKVESSWDISSGRMGLDIGPQAREKYGEVIAHSKTILWNGPMGVFEWPVFAGGTQAVAIQIAEATMHNGAFSLVGGGDSVAAINQYNLRSGVSYISTGGGAMLEYLEGQCLPGIQAIEAH